VLAVGWFGCVLLTWSAGGIVFDVLRAAAVLGIPGLPPVVDWPGMVVRTVALGAAALVAVTMVSYRRRSGSGCLGCGRDSSARVTDGKWLGYAACALALPYPLLKVYWSLGGTVANSAVTASEMFPVGEVISFATAGALALGLVQGWGRVLPRWMLVVGGWAATVPLVTMGAVAGFGSLAQGLGLIDGPVRFDNGTWIVSVVYGSWLLLGLALGSATLAYQRRMRPRCARCDL
jgi:hypothetical protein